METQRASLLQPVWSLSTWGGVFFAFCFLTRPLPSCVPQNCSIAVCQRIKCDIPFFGIQEEFNATLKGNLSFGWYIKVCGVLMLRRAQAWCSGPRCSAHPLSSTDLA